MAKAKQKPSRREILRRRTLAKNLRKRRESPLGRLSEDGASSPGNINRRLQWLAAEWKLDAPPAAGRTPSEKLGSYCRRHRISFDWMLTGCPADLKKMVDERRSREAVARVAAELAAAYDQLSIEQKTIVTAEIRRILAERDQ